MRTTFDGPFDDGRYSAESIGREYHIDSLGASALRRSFDEISTEVLADKSQQISQKTLQLILGNPA